jgi:hypothetical protein
MPYDHYGDTGIDNPASGDESHHHTNGWKYELAAYRPARHAHRDCDSAHHGVNYTELPPGYVLEWLGC